MYTAKGQLDANALLKQYSPLVRRLAHQMIAKLPANVELDDLIQVGMIGLSDALSRFDAAQGVQFETFATQRIRGAMLDELRANDWLPRSARKSQRDIENAIHHLELSFEVRDPENSLQYWVASCRWLGEALLNMSTYSITKDAADYVRRASEVLNGAAAKISSSEHPNQWAEIQTQLARCGERKHV